MPTIVGMKTVVINNRENMDIYQMQPVGKDLRGVPILGPLVVLLPGANLVDSTKVDALMGKVEGTLGNPGFALKFEAKIPRTPAPEQNPEKSGRPYLEFLQVETKEGKKPLVVDDKLPLRKLSPEIAAKLIAETLIPGTLKQWNDEESRPEVRAEINKQMAEIGAHPAGPAANLGT